jgi:hypothetical protein
VIAVQFSLAPDPSSWGADLGSTAAEPDDYLHNPDPRRDRKHDSGGTICTPRGIANLGCLALLALGLLALLYVVRTSMLNVMLIVCYIVRDTLCSVTSPRRS